MLTPEIRKKIIDFVSLQPRSIDEVAKYINKNWRTANRYIDIIAQEGLISTKVFREGTRGALKIVYLNHIEKGNFFMYSLVEEIKQSRYTQEFHAFNIYQFIDKEKKKAYITKKPELKQLIMNSKKELLMFSGNLSLKSLENSRSKLLEMFRDITSKGVIVNILARVDFTSESFIRKLLELGNISIRHRLQPLRGFIIDERIAILIDDLESFKHKPKELSKKGYIIYEIHDLEWIEWLKKVFFDMYNSSISADKRLVEMSRIIDQSL